jgi:hypothetical protein
MTKRAVELAKANYAMPLLKLMVNVSVQVS